MRKSYQQQAERCNDTDAMPCASCVVHADVAHNGDLRDDNADTPGMTWPTNCEACTLSSLACNCCWAEDASTRRTAP